MQTVKIKIYAPDIEPRFRHATIFEAYESLNSGETMELTNDARSKTTLLSIHGRA